MSLISCVVRRSTGSRRLKTAMGMAVVALCAALAGCGAQPASPAPATTSAPSTTPAAIPSSAAPTGAPTAPTAPTGPARAATATPAAHLVEYGRQGGLAGVDDRFVVEPDGSFTISRRGGAVGRGRLASADLAELRQVLDGSHFGQIPAVNPGDGVADGFTYHVVYAGHEVLAADGGVPDALRPVLAQLEELLQRYGGR